MPRRTTLGPIDYRNRRTGVRVEDGTADIADIVRLSVSAGTLTDNGERTATLDTSGSGGGSIQDVDISGWSGNIAALVVDTTVSKLKALAKNKQVEITGALKVSSVVGGQVVNLASAVDHVIAQLSLTRDNSGFGITGIGALAGEIVTEPVGWASAQDATAGLNGTSTSLTGTILTRSSVGVYQNIFTIRSDFDSSTAGDRRWGTSANLPYAWAINDYITFYMRVFTT